MSGGDFRAVDPQIGPPVCILTFVLSSDPQVAPQEPVFLQKDSASKFQIASRIS